MKKIYPFFLIGLLSMFFAEIFSGASAIWFTNLWGVFFTFPLYMFHVLFLLWIAVRYNRVSLRQLYFLGIIFALYEAWISKVIWTGYLGAAGPEFGTVFGLAFAEFLVLVFFWHPVMSFIVPLIVFQLLTGKVFPLHADILRKTRVRSYIIVLSILLFSAFIANGNSFDNVSANTSVLGTLFLIVLAAKKSKGSNILSLYFKKRYFILTAFYLIILYCAGFLLFLPEKIPGRVVPYMSVFVFYACSFMVLARSGKTSTCLTELPEDSYSSKDMLMYVVLLILAVNVACLVPYISTMMIGAAYLSMMLAGIILFSRLFYREIKYRAY